MSTSKPLLFIHSVRYTPWTQLLHRIRLEAKRRILVWLHRAVRRPARPISARAKIRSRKDLPGPVFPARQHLVERVDTGYVGILLNVRKPLRAPMTWLPKVNQLDLVTLHYMEYLEGVDDETFISLVLDWIRNNPPYQPGYWQHHWNSYALSLRCLVWMQQMAVRGEQVRNHPDILTSLWEQLDFLQHNLEIDIRGNHLLKNIKTLMWGSRFFEGMGHWHEKAVALLQNELSNQFTADGFHFEASPGYHIQVFADMLECYSILNDSPIKKQLGGKLDLMAQVVVDLRHPDGFPSLFGDSGFHMAYSPGACLEAYQSLTGHQAFPRPSFAFRNAGIFGFRAKDSLLVVDCGKVGPDVLPAHGHGDILAFELSLLGRRVIVDTGVFEYQEGARRAHSRSTAAHNTVNIDEADQAEFWKSFRVGRRPNAWVEELSLGNDQFLLQGAHDGFARMPGRPIHQRRVEYREGYLKVRDRVLGGRGQHIQSRLLLHPDLMPRIVAGGVDSDVGEGTLMIRSAQSIHMQKALWWPDFGCEYSTHQLIFDYGLAPGEGSFEIQYCDRRL